MFSTKCRVGRFFVSSEIMQKHEAMMLIQDGMYVIDTTYSAWRRRHEFTAVCGEFQEIQESQVPPMYDIQIIEVKDGMNLEYRRKVIFRGYGDQ